MALYFSTNSEKIFEIAITCDLALDMTQEEKTAYLKTGEGLKVKEGSNPTFFKIKALSPKEREAVELAAGAYSRSELGRILWSEEPSESREKAYWREALSEVERKALQSYELYISRVYEEMIQASVLEVVGVEGKPYEIIQQIRPDADRIRAMSELILHIQRLSLLGSEGK